MTPERRSPTTYRPADGLAYLFLDFNAGVAARLARSGIGDFMSLWNLQPKRARAIWGSVMGERSWYGLHGYDVYEEPTKKSMIGHSRVLSREHEAPAAARIVARALLLKAASRLRHYGMHASALSLSLRLRPEGGWGGDRRFDYVQDSFRLLKCLDSLWADYMRKRRFEEEPTRIGGVTVYLHGLAKEEDAILQQGDLFADLARHEKDARRAQLWRAIDLINADPDAKFRNLSAAPDRRPLSRYITLASQSGLDLNYLGAKIAFSRVPEEAEFLY